MKATPFPLTWPLGWQRTPARNRQKARFGHGALSVAAAMDRLEAELGRLGAHGTTLSSNIERRLDGGPRSGAAEPADPGVAIYFTMRQREMVLACDRWTRAADNIAAIAAHINALRGIDRWGVGSLEQAFAGYAALPPPEDWRAVLGDHGTLEGAEGVYRVKARLAHPDQVGGSHEEMARLNRAIEAARRELKA